MLTILRHYLSKGGDNMEELELIRTISHMLLGTAAVITGIIGIIKGINAFVNYLAKKNAILSDISSIKKEQQLFFKALKACLDGLEQLGCNHTVSETKKDLDEWLNAQAHD